MNRPRQQPPLTDAQREYFAQEDQELYSRYEAEQEYIQREHEALEREIQEELNKENE